MSDVFDSYGSTEAVGTSELRRPPVPLLIVGAVLVAVSLGMFAVDSRVGYGLALATMILSSMASRLDLTARADFNYVTLDWYRPASAFLRLTTLLVATGHITVLAIESAR